MPIPPALAKDLAYSSLRNERQTPAPPLPPNGPSPSMPVNIWLNLEWRNTASKSIALARALALPSTAGLASGAVSEPSDSAPSEATPVCEARAGKAAISHHLDVCLDRTGGLDRLQNGDHVERPDAERIEPVDELLQRHAFPDHGELLAVLLHADARARSNNGAAARERRRLADLRGFGDGDRQISLRDGDRRYPHVASDHDDAGALVDHVLGRKIGLDLQLLDFGQQRDHVAGVFLRQRELHGRVVLRHGDRPAEKVVDRGRDAFGGGEIRVAQGEPDLIEPVEREFDLTLDDGAVGDASDGRHAAGDLGGLTLRHESRHRERALADRIDIAVGAEQRR